MSILDPMALWGREMSRAEMLALIAAAPDLLSALKNLCDTLAADDMEGLIEHAEPMMQARAAIAKAEASA